MKYLLLLLLTATMSASEVSASGAGLPWYLGVGWTLGGLCVAVAILLLIMSFIEDSPMVDISWNARIRILVVGCTVWVWLPWLLYGLHLLAVNIPFPPVTTVEPSKPEAQAEKPQ